MEWLLFLFSAIAFIAGHWVGKHKQHYIVQTMQNLNDHLHKDINERKNIEMFLLEKHDQQKQLTEDLLQKVLNKLQGKQKVDMLTEYTAAEKKLIGAISSHWLNTIKEADIYPKELYEILALEVFCKNKKGSEVDALRRVVKAIRNCEVYRLTPEFDKLCEF